MTMHQAPIICYSLFRNQLCGCKRVLGTTRCSRNVLLQLHGIGSNR
jgi:hypothetical protein